MGRKVSLNKNRHLAKIMNNLDEMRNEGGHCDFSINVGSNTYHAHRNVLSAGSEYFKALFRHRMEENQHAEMEMKDMDSECLECCIDFIYTGELYIPDGKNSELLYASQILQLNDVRDAIIDELEHNLDVKNFFSTKQIAKLFDLTSTFEKCKKFEKENILVLCCQPDFQNEEKISVLEILSSDEFFLSEKQKLDIAINWVGGKAEKKDDFLELLNLIDLTNVPLEYIKNLIEKNPLTSIDFKLYKTFNDAHRNVLERSLAELKMKKKSDEEANVLENVDDGKLMFFNLDEDRLQIIEPVTNETEMLNESSFWDLTSPLDSFTAICLNSLVYILCTDKSVHRLNYKDPNAKWEKMPDMNKNHGWRPPAVSTLDSVFVIGGGSSSGISDVSSSVVERFDPTAMQWSRLMDAPSPITFHAVVSLNEAIYCLGGRINGRISNAFSAFNVPLSLWTDLPPMENAKESCCAVAVNSRIFAFGGRMSGRWFKKVECFNTMTSQWSTISQMNETIGLPCASRFGDWIFIGSRRSSTDEIVKYNVINSEWQPVTGFPSFSWEYFIKI